MIVKVAVEQRAAGNNVMTKIITNKRPNAQCQTAKYRDYLGDRRRKLAINNDM